MTVNNKFLDLHCSCLCCQSCITIWTTSDRLLSHLHSFGNKMSFYWAEPIMGAWTNLKLALIWEWQKWKITPLIGLPWRWQYTIPYRSHKRETCSWKRYTLQRELGTWLRQHRNNKMLWGFYTETDVSIPLVDICSSFWWPPGHLSSCLEEPSWQHQLSLRTRLTLSWLCGQDPSALADPSTSPRHADQWTEDPQPWSWRWFLTVVWRIDECCQCLWMVMMLRRTLPLMWIVTSTLLCLELLLFLIG